MSILGCNLGVALLSSLPDDWIPETDPLRAGRPLLGPERFAELERDSRRDSSVSLTNRFQVDEQPDISTLIRNLSVTANANVLGR